MAHRLPPKTIALWRYEQIREALGEGLSREVRGEIVRRIARTPVQWPSGTARRISAATLYRWIKAYEEGGGLEALRPAPRRDKGTRRSKLPDLVVTRALALLGEDDQISLTFLVAVLHCDPEVKRLGVKIPRSTLQRRLAADPAYARLKQARKRSRRRRRFVARSPHEIWHCDAKGPVKLRLKSGERIEFHVLTILDDATRYVLAAIVVRSPDLAAAVRVFRQAAKRWGLPGRLYLDCASIFDSVAFRDGLAEVGSHRIRTKPRNPEAHGKIEAYHRSLILWFTDRLGKQIVVDLVHLQQLLEGMLEKIYLDHYHREIKRSPRKALDGLVSPRAVSPARLEDAFRQEKRLKAHHKTGEVDFPGGKFLVPDLLRGQRLTFRIDPDPSIPPLVVEPGTGRLLPLERAAVRPEDLPPEPSPPVERWGDGMLQQLYDDWRGLIRPQAEPGFGLPEILALLAEAAGRPVPQSDGEAARIQRRYRAIGPLPRVATESALRGIGSQLGPGRPLEAYLDALEQRVTSHPTKTKKGTRKKKP